MTKLTRAGWLVLGSIALIAVAAGVAYATIPSGGVISACYANRGGDLKLIDVDEGGKCGKGWTQIDWNQQGPKGDRGEPGTPGERGPQGPTGPAGALPDASFASAMGTAKFNEQEVLRRVVLPAGSYLITADFMALHDHPGLPVTVACKLVSSASGVGVGFEGVLGGGGASFLPDYAGDGETARFSTTNPITVEEPTTIQTRCLTSNSVVDVDVTTKLTILKVGSVTYLP